MTDTELTERIRLFLEPTEPIQPVSSIRVDGCNDEQNAHVFPGPGLDDTTRCRCGKYTFAERQRR